MSDQSNVKDPGAIWRDQPEEKTEVTLQQFVNRRTEELYVTSRSEILASVAAALLFLVVVAWRFAAQQEDLPRFGIGMVCAWVLLTIYRFRDRIWRRGAAATSDAAATGLEYYRRELERRRDHLRNAWVWHGPLVLACVIFALNVAGKAFPGRLGSALPLIVLLVMWTAVAASRRRRQARKIQAEIDELQPD